MYSNSKMIQSTELSPNLTLGRRDISIITPHCYVGEASTKSMLNYFAKKDTMASSNYVIGKDGSIGLCVEEKNRSWCTSSSWNDNRAVTIECACEMYAPNTINDAVYKSLIYLIKDICERNGKKHLIYINKWDMAEKFIKESQKKDEIVITFHKWFANKECPGQYIISKMPNIVEQVNKMLEGDKPEIISKDMQWCILNKLIVGDGTGKYYPNKELTREQAATLIRKLYNMLK